jgi:hypothetical protein
MRLNATPMSINFLRQKLPEVKAWIDRTLGAHAADARPVASLGFKRLGDYYPAALLESAKVVAVREVPKLPLGRMGLSGFEEFERLEAAGITYRDTYFVRAKLSGDESLHFHELVHVMQWTSLGMDDFILGYALGHQRHGYGNNPFERTAYDLQERFERGEAGFNAGAVICAAAERDFGSLIGLSGAG